jgi:hypothetical protein
MRGTIRAYLIEGLTLAFFLGAFFGLSVLLWGLQGFI